MAKSSTLFLSLEIILSSKNYINTTNTNITSSHLTNISKVLLHQWYSRMLESRYLKSLEYRFLKFERMHGGSPLRQLFTFWLIEASKRQHFKLRQRLRYQSN